MSTHSSTTSASRGLAALALAGAMLVLAARGVAPLAPPLYDGITVAPAPFCYVSPPPDLASSNCHPTGGQMELPVSGGSNKLATVQTDDKQVLAFFPQAAISATAPFTIKITPEASPPPPPAANALVGNVYRIEVQGATTQPPLAMAAQVLLRIPPHKLSSVQEFYDGAWHDTQWGAQTDYINLTLDHLGLLAAFDDGKHSQPPSTQFNPIGIIEAALVLVAIVIIVVAIVVQRRRGKAPLKPAEWGPGKRR